MMIVQQSLYHEEISGPKIQSGCGETAKKYLDKMHSDQNTAEDFYPAVFSIIAVITSRAYHAH